MRKVPSQLTTAKLHFRSPAPASALLLSEVPPPSSSASSRCDTRKCPWWPYSSSRDFKLNTIFVLLFLLCTVIFALAFNIAIRYVIALHCTRRRRRRVPDPPPPEDRNVEIPSLIYSEGTKLARTGTECAICLSEFAIGESIGVVEKCGHGFHLQCIQRWLASHSSCPTCRANW